MQGSTSSKELQILLLLQYRELLYKKRPLPMFDDIQFRAYSQNGEDGILLYVFSLIGVTDKRVVEICAGDGIECNAANLIINHGWNAVLFDANAEKLSAGRSFYTTCKDTSLWPPKLVESWITAENVDSLIGEHGFFGEIDLLSLDMDGNDYWVWKAIESVSPRVVILEYNNLWGPERAVTIPYQPDFKADYNAFGVDYGGASLSAFVKLGREKGYRLIGCERYGFNAVFVKAGIGEDIFPEIAPVNCFNHPFSQHARTERFANINGREWVDV